MTSSDRPAQYPTPAPVTRFSHMRELVAVPDGRVGRVESIQTTDDKVIFGVTVGVDAVRVEITRYPEPTRDVVSWAAVETDADSTPFGCAPNGPGYYAPHIHTGYGTPDWFTYRRVGGDWWTAQRNVLPGEGTPVWFDETPEPTQDSPE